MKRFGAFGFCLLESVIIERKRQPEFRSLIRRLADLDRSAVGFEDSLDDGQPQAGSAALGGEKGRRRFLAFGLPSIPVHCLGQGATRRGDCVWPGRGRCEGRRISAQAASEFSNRLRKTCSKRKESPSIARFPSPTSSSNKTFRSCQRGFRLIQAFRQTSRKSKTDSFN